MAKNYDSGNTNMGMVLLISIVATIGGFLFGYDSGVINGTVDGMEAAFDAANITSGFNVASVLLGCAIGALCAGRLADILGRRTLLIVSAVLFTISAWGSGIAHSSGEFVLYRILGGLGVGAASIMAPAYIAEIAPAHIRGRLTTIQQVAILSGIFCAFLSNFALAGAAGGSTNEFWLGFQAWRWMFWMEGIPSVIFFFALFLIPESPRYLVLKDKTEQAKAVLTRLFGSASAEQKVAEIQESLAKDHKPRLRDLVDPQTNKVRSIVWLGIGLAILQQVTGINVIFYYGAVLWQAAGFTESDALLTNVISSGVGIFAVIISLMLIDKIGRKPILMIGSVGMAVTLALAAFAFSTGTMNADASGIELSPNMGILALVAANLFVGFFNFSWGPVMWVMLGEMFPNQIRGSSLAVSGLAQWMANFGITLTFIPLLQSIGLAGAYGIYALFGVVSIFYVAAKVHETRGIELEDMKG